MQLQRATLKVCLKHRLFDETEFCVRASVQGRGFEGLGEARWEAEVNHMCRCCWTRCWNGWT
jgi:hypothetical protein